MTSAKKWGRTQNLVASGLFVCLGLIIPYVCSHAFGVPGTVLLPMHLPVLLCGFFCGPRYGALCGLVVPVLSCLVTGMPPPWPMLPIMACELFAYGFVSGLCRHKFRLPLFVSLPAAMLAGRVVYGLVFGLLTLVATGPFKALPVWGAITTGLPGIALQAVLVPVILKVFGQKSSRAPLPAAPAPDWDETALLAQGQRIRAGEYSCIVLQNGQVVYQADGRGVSPLLRLFDSDKEKFAGAMVADKIIGKAAAMILVCGGVQAVYGEVMSSAAQAYLQARGIPCRYGRCVGMISNRTGNGICPIEQSVLEIDDPHEGMQAMRKTISRLMAAG